MCDRIAVIRYVAQCMTILLDTTNTEYNYYYYYCNFAPFFSFVSIYLFFHFRLPFVYFHFSTIILSVQDSEGIPYKSASDTFNRVLQEGKNRQLLRTTQPLPLGNATIQSTVKNTMNSVLGPYTIFFSGVGPRVTWISIGGFFFFGAYEQAKSVLLSVS